jgi:hypothetical protein
MGPRVLASAAMVWLPSSLVRIGVLALGFAFSTGGEEPEKKAKVLYTPTDPFRQLEEILPTPTQTRNAAGAPGHRYWQQEVDYDIDVEIDDAKQRLIGSETITYHNNSPDELRYLWLQLDANIYHPESDRSLISTTPGFDRMGFRALTSILAGQEFDGSIKLSRVQHRGKDLKYKVVKTMMRIELPKPLKPGKKFKFDVDWSYAINNSDEVSGRTGYEFFEKDGNNIYEIAQWFPRLAPYEDVNGWQHKQFLGRGEFALEFGDYEVDITVPADHIVASTGKLTNEKKVLSKKQRARLDEARESDKPVFIVTPEEAKIAQTKTAKDARGKKTWRFKAENVRDFAFATSRKFIWDAQGHDSNGQDVLAMSFYPIEGEPMWSRYSTRAVVHTLEVYSRYTIDYPYPVAISVNGPVGGMEYPMICFNGPRPEEDGTYSKRTKYGLIGVIIHEVGHNYFPMIINSDERQWTWMDEGLNTFVQFLAQQEWEKDYPSRRGEARNITGYMASEYQVPIMTNSESLLQFGNNAYGKPATALNILRETILGRELFDYAFKEYARRWKFRRPMPADFFRTMEDASGVDLDWFFRGWFYTTYHTDIAITGIQELELDTGDPEIRSAKDKAERDEKPAKVTETHNTEEGMTYLVDELPELKDFYNDYDALDVTPRDRKRYERMLGELEDHERKLLKTKKRFFTIDFENQGGLIMPILLEIEYASGKKEELRIPAEIWRSNAERVSKLIVADEAIVAVTLDPHLETADVDLSDNHWPPEIPKTRFEVFKREKRKNPMQRAKAPEADAQDAEKQDKRDKEKAQRREERGSERGQR